MEGMERKERVLQAVEGDNLKVEILEFERLDGAQHVDSAEKIYFANQAGIKMRRIRLTLDDTSVNIEPGLLHYMKGDLEIKSQAGGGGKSGGGLRGFGRAMMRKVTSGESMFQTEIAGTGVIYLEPSFKHYLIEEMDDQEYIADKGIFVAASAEIEVGSKMQGNVSSALFGGEGLFQTALNGSGIAIFASPVPLSELEMFELEDEKMSVDGSFAILRDGQLEFAAETSTRSVVGFFTSGEKFLQTFTGTGRLWIAPTQEFYDDIEEARLAQLVQAQSAARKAAEEDDD